MAQLQTIIEESFFAVFPTIGGIYGEFLSKEQYGVEAWEYYKRDCEAWEIDPGFDEDEFIAAAKEIYSQKISNFFTIEESDAEGTIEDPSYLRAKPFEFIFDTKEKAVEELNSIAARLKGISTLNGDTLYITHDASDRLQTIYNIKNL